MDDNQNNKDTLPNRALSTIFTIFVLSLVLIFLIYSKNVVFGSELGGFVYKYFHDWNPIPFWIPIAVIALIALAIFIFTRLIQKFEAVSLIGVYLITFAIQTLLQRIYPYSMDEVIPNVYANSYYSIAKQFSAYDLLAHFQDLVVTFAAHARSNMPGKSLLFNGLLLITNDPQFLGYLVIAVSSIGGLLIYGICNSLIKDKKAGLYAFILYSLIPCKLVFFPILNTVTPIFILLSLYLFVKFLDSRKPVWLILLGVSLYLLILFDPSPLVAGIIFIFLLLHSLFNKKISYKDLLRIFLIPVASFMVVFLVFRIFFSFDLFAAFQFILKDAIAFNIIDHRSYPIWLRENLKEFFYGAGLPIMGLVIFILIDRIVHVKEMGKEVSKWPIEIFYLTGVVLTFVTVLLMGINRGETTRLWIYLAVFFQVPAALLISKMKYSNFIFYMFTLLLVAQSIISLQRVGFVIPY